MDEDWKGYCKMNMDTDKETPRRRGRDCVQVKWSFLLLTLSTFLLVVLLVIIFALCGYQERKFAELTSYVSSDSGLNAKMQNTETQLEKLWTQLKSLSQTSHVNSTRAHDQPDSEDQAKKLSEIETLINNLGSSLGSFSSKLETKVQNMATQEDGHYNELKNDLQSLESKLQDVAMQQEEHYTQLNIDLQILRYSVVVLASKLQDVDQGSRAIPREYSCNPGWMLFYSMCYFISSNKLNWHDARDYCRAQNASLIKLQTKDDWAFATKIFLPYEYWVGLTDEITGQWRWDDGTPFPINKDQWNPDQPDDWKDHGLGEEGEDCGQIADSRKLNDRHCSELLKFICQSQPSKSA